MTLSEIFDAEYWDDVAADVEMDLAAETAYEKRMSRRCPECGGPTATTCPQPAQRMMEGKKMSDAAKERYLSMRRLGDKAAVGQISAFNLFLEMETMVRSVEHELSNTHEQLAELRNAHSWRPIETIDRASLVIVASIVDGKILGVATGYVDTDDDELCHYSPYHPTHWMPVPPPPAKDDREAAMEALTEETERLGLYATHPPKSDA